MIASFWTVTELRSLVDPVEVYAVSSTNPHDLETLPQLPNSLLFRPTTADSDSYRKFWWDAGTVQQRISSASRSHKVDSGALQRLQRVAQMTRLPKATIETQWCLSQTDLGDAYPRDCEP